jgi:hypothetical protein
MNNDRETAHLIRENLNSIFNALSKGEIPTELIPNETINILLQVKDQLRLSARQAHSQT